MKHMSEALARCGVIYNRGEIAGSSVSAVVGFQLIWSRSVSAA